MHWVLPFRKRELTPEQAWKDYIRKLRAWEEAEKLLIFHARRTALSANAAADYAVEATINVRKAIAKRAIVMTEEEQR